MGPSLCPSQCPELATDYDEDEDEDDDDDNMILCQALAAAECFASALLEWEPRTGQDLQSATSLTHHGKVLNEETEKDLLFR